MYLFDALKFLLGCDVMLRTTSNEKMVCDCVMVQEIQQKISLVFDLLILEHSLFMGCVDKIDFTCCFAATTEENIIMMHLIS
mmetsp:Transcript_3417/g.4964  ORF Transcript_3417/g.4964 Transcript_3417/m.4964 type:complete len:82 (-) Transcript_3417:56-301(-)